MPGRQAHGRPLLANTSKGKSKKKSQAKSQDTALDALAIAAAQNNEVDELPRSRNIEYDSGKKRERHDDEDDDEEGLDDEKPQRKKTKQGGGDGLSDEDFASDSDGNEWTMGGLADGQDDSEIDSDDAFGDSDEEKFEGFKFRGSRTTRDDGDKDEDEDMDDDGDSLGSDAIDLAAALDQADEESLEEEGEDRSDLSDDESTSPSSDEFNDFDEDDDDDDEGEKDPNRAANLSKLVSAFADGDVPGNKEEGKASTRQKVALRDLLVSGLDDPHMKKSLRLLSKEEKQTKPGGGKKLTVPLARRQQDRVLRQAAFEKTKETLDKWTESVKHMHRAEHIVFPLPHTDPNSGIDNSELKPLDIKNSTNELEQTISFIMERSGLSLKKPEPKPRTDEETAELRELANKRRLQRELNSLEAKRTRRIKKIKSKAYHRVHRRKRERDELAEHEERAENGEISSEEEREAQDRQRALERVGARHRQSKWVKKGSQVKRAVWDDDYRASLADMSRREEELLKRKEGRSGDPNEEEDDDLDDSASDSGDDRERILNLLKEQDVDQSAPTSRLMGLKFMQRGEEALKKQNDDLVAQMQRDLASDQEDDDVEEPEESGRRQYGMRNEEDAGPAESPFTMSAARNSRKKGPLSSFAGVTPGSKDSLAISAPISNNENEPTAAEGGWSQAKPRRHPKSTKSRITEDFDTEDILTVSQPEPETSRSKPAKTKSSSQTKQPSRPAKPAAHDTDSDSATSSSGSDSDSDSEDAAAMHLPLEIKDQEFYDRAFAGEDVAAQFALEKAELADEQDEKKIDTALPGWGGWSGEGIKKKDKGRNASRFVTKVEGIKKSNRKDAKLEKVIINEKRFKKVSFISPRGLMAS